MNSLKAFKKIITKYGKTNTLEGTYNDFLTIKKDLEILDFIKTHYKINGFNELIPLYLDYDDDKKFDELERWLENE